MTIKGVTVPDGLVRLIVYASAILGAGWGVARPIIAVNRKLDNLIFDICSHTDPAMLRTYRSCQVSDGFLVMPTQADL